MAVLAYCVCVRVTHTYHTTQPHIRRTQPQEVPQALRSKPHEVFGSRIAALQQLGIDGEVLRGVVGGSTVFLTTKGAPQEQLAFLKEDLGFNTEQVGVGVYVSLVGIGMCACVLACV